MLALVGLGTLYEVLEGGKDTHELALRAKEQADKMKDMSDAADKIRQAAEGMVTQEQRIADFSSNAIQRNTDMAKAAIANSQAVFRDEQRAWVGIDVSVNGPLTFRSDAVLLPLNLHVSNVGHSPLSM